MKILNLYAGIGGNRKLWGNEHEITAIEINEDIAKVYQKHFPNDKVVIGDAHKYLLEHFEEFDFIWSSPPCPTHSRIRKARHDQNKPIYPNMQLYEEILLLQGYFKGKWIVENVISWYEPLIRPYEIGGHYFWCSNILNKERFEKRGIGDFDETIESLEKNRFDLSNFDIDYTNKKIMLRNCVEPKLGLYVFKEIFKVKNTTVGDFLSPKGESLIAINQN